MRNEKTYKMREKQYVLLFIINMLFFSFLYSQTPLGETRGIKWKQELPPRGEVYHDQVYGRLEKPEKSDGSPMSLEEIVDKLASSGITAVNFRVDKQSRYIDEEGDGKRDNMLAYNKELAEAARLLKNRNIKVYLWIRLWLTNNDAKDAVDNFAPVLDDDDLRSLIDGVSFTESQLRSMNRVKSMTISIAKRFNERYDDWLKNRDLLMPGRGNGIDFTGVNIKDTFHRDILEEVNNFAFIVKGMKPKSQHGGDNPKYDKWKTHFAENNAAVNSRINWLNEGFQLNELVKYQNETPYRKASHIVYWGDSGDAFAQSSPKGTKAIHKILTKRSKRVGSFFMSVPASDETMELTRTQLKSLFIIDTDTDELVENQMSMQGAWSHMTPHKLFFEWFKKKPRFTKLDQNKISDVGTPKAISFNDNTIFIDKNVTLSNETPITKVYDITGAKVLKSSMNNRNTIDISHLQNGIYIIKYGIETLKIVKM